MEKLDNTTEVNVSASSGFSEIFNPINNYLHKGNPVVLITLTVIMLIYYLLFRTLGSGDSAGIINRPMPETPGTSFLEVLMWGIFIFLILINGLQYFFSIDAKAAVKNLFSEKPELDITVLAEQEIKSKPITQSPEVFHVPKNLYTFEDAKSLCKAYDSRLATFDEVNKAYNSGAEWCTYGWTDGQMALYPTQKNTWEAYQKIDGHEHDCGRPGINGGYIKNPNVRFGVNCFGGKPKIRPEEESRLGVSPFPLSPEEKEADAKIEFYKKHIPDIMLSPFNYDNWASI